MIKLAIVMFSCLALTASAQNNFPSEINTTKSASHINILGTRVFMIPPDGFRVSATQPAIENSKSGLVQVMDLVGGNFYTNAATFSKERFEQKGIKVFEHKTLKVNGYPAKMVLIQAAGTTKAYNLVFGDSTFSTMVMGTFEATDIATGEQVKQALLSVYYDKTNEVDPFAAAPFKLDDTKSMLKFSRFTASLYMYTIGGVKKESYGNEPYFLVFVGPIAGTTLKAIADDMAELLEGANVKNVSEGKTNGFPSLKREVYGKLEGKSAVLFQHIVLIGENAIVMQGIATNNFEKYMTEFQQLSSTIDKK